MAFSAELFSRHKTLAETTHHFENSPQSMDVIISFCKNVADYAKDEIKHQEVFLNDLVFKLVGSDKN